MRLFNPAGTPASLDGWSVQYANTTGTGDYGVNNPVPLTDTVPPDGYDLIQLAAGRDGTAAPTPAAPAQPA